jgi:pyruvate dehydrogenase E2 component (dihydrolipoamide acetyltransferase)
MAEIQMPQLGETVTEGTITKWLKSVGDEITEDEAIVEVSTDKVDSEIPSPVSGTLTEIKVEEGETVDVGAVLAVVGDGAAGAGEGAAAAPADQPDDQATADEPQAAEAQ